MCCEVVLTVEKARAHLESSLNMPVSRTTFYKWRRKLNLIERRLTLPEIEAIALYGQYITDYRDADYAKKLTIQELRSQSNE